MKKMRLLACLLFLMPSFLRGQSFEILFPTLEGPELFDSLTANYRPNTVLNYAMARDTLYGKIMGIDDDSLRCIYSGHTLYLDPTQDPTQYIYQNGGSLGMNTEHAYPQGKGAADGNARSDMHHLFPARIPVNEARGEFPFAEIPDAQTEKWFYKTQTMTSIPSQNINRYAEYKNGAFEPMEASKGDIARAVFYFYTMYKAQANTADPNYFELQRPTLCNWNELDPADSAELVKTWRIAPYQDGKPNPFILDCTLAYRTYCPNTIPACATAIHPIGKEVGFQARISPNPFQGAGVLEMDLPYAGRLEWKISDLLGRPIFSAVMEQAPAGHFTLPINIQAPASVMGVLQVELRSESQTTHNKPQLLLMGSSAQ